MSSSAATIPTTSIDSRVTESLSPVTLDLDSCSNTLSMVRLLALNDAPLLFGPGILPGLCDASHIHTATLSASWMAAALENDFGHVVFSGAGTSGRLAQFHARELNNTWSRAGGSSARTPFSYLLAGGDAAVVLPQESAEDSDEAAAAALSAWCAVADKTEAANAPQFLHPRRRLLVAISCGLSAPFVMGLIARCLNDPTWRVLAIGFNELSALTVPLPAAAALLARVHASPLDTAALLNPSLGPESVAGSSRLKGGTATSALIQSIATVAFNQWHKAATPPIITTTILDALIDYGTVISRTYAIAAEDIAEIAHVAGVALVSKHVIDHKKNDDDGSGDLLETTGSGRLFYLGVGAAGALALTDASECPPTFGALFNTVRGFVAGGWRTVLGENHLAPTPMAVPMHLRSQHATGEGEPVRVDMATFTLAVARGAVTVADVVVLVVAQEDDDDKKGREEALSEALSALCAAANAGATVRHVVVTRIGSTVGDEIIALVRKASPLGVCVALPSLRLRNNFSSDNVLPPSLAHAAIKTVLNAVSTLAHVAAGAIHRGRMVKMSITNIKLYRRAVGIVSDASGVGAKDAERALLECIYGEHFCVEALSVLMAGGERTKEHVLAASEARDILPTAIILAAQYSIAAASGGGAMRPSIESARKLLQLHVRLHLALAALRRQ